MEDKKARTVVRCVVMLFIFLSGYIVGEMQLTEERHQKLEIRKAIYQKHGRNLK